jgi:hypothetical protein
MDIAPLLNAGFLLSRWPKYVKGTQEAVVDAGCFFRHVVTLKPAEMTRILVVLDAANIGWAFGNGRFNAEVRS